MKPRVIYLLTLLTVVFGFTLAAPKPAAADDEDPPSRVARLSSAKGEVSFSPAGTDDWVSAETNRPLTTGDKLWTADGARAELHVGSAAVRLSSQTGFSFLNLDDQIMQMRLTEGTIYISVRRLEENESIEVDTPNLAFSILRPGRYRLNVNEAGDTTIINVRDGEGEVTGSGSSFTVHAGDQGYFSGTDSLSADVQPLPGEDDFDRWVSDRDYREEHAVARRYVSDDVIGYEDLDDNGGWRQVPEYGTVWFPHTTIVGWAPYRYGHWAWVSPWGWTWVDDAPWGFAPFHYGRWVSVRGAWGWIPAAPRVVGVVYVRPVYAPALVAWVGGPRYAGGVAYAGGGGGFAAGVSVGWFPLGPREVFVPSYPVSRRYVNNVNVSNTTVNTTIVNNYYNTTVINKNVTNVRYVNQNVNGAVTATSGQAFSSAQPVGRNMVAVDQREVRTAPAYAAAPAVAPPKQAVLGAGIATRVQPPAALQNRAVVAKAAPPPAPIPFTQRQQAIQANQGRPISMTQNRQLAVQHAQAAPTAVAPVRIAPAPTRTMVIANRPTPAAGANTQAQPNNNNRVAQPVQPNANRPVQTVPPNTNRPADPVPPNANRPAQPVQPNTGRPPNAPAPAAQNPSATVNNPNGNAKNYGDRPQTARPNSSVNPQLEQQHTQQIQQLQQKQDQEYQKVQQKQLQQQKINQQNADKLKQQQLQQNQQQLQQQQQHAQEQQKINQQNADKLKQEQLEQRQQQLQQQQQAQLQQLQQKQNAERQQLNAKQQAEHVHGADKPSAADKPAPKPPPKKDKEDDHKH